MPSWVAKGGFFDESILSAHELLLINEYRTNIEVTHDAEEAQALCVKLYDLLCNAILNRQ